MQCKKCGKDIVGEEHRMVAEWPFCMDCFQHLMEKPAKKAEAPAETPAEAPAETVAEPEKEDVSVQVVFEQARQKCTLCEKEIEGDQYKKVGIWTFCPECHLDMTPRPKPPPPPEPEEEAVDEEEEAAMRARFRVKYIHRVKCAACGRMVPEGGSKSVDEEPYCPDCYYGLPEEVRQAAEEAEAAAMAGEEAETAEMSREIEAPVEPPEIEAVPGCESCGKEVAEDKLQTVEGFAICQACLSSDAELAVHLARARHQKRLQRLKDELGS
jgi:formylmethanofuran dehydrogenase subunit E